MAQPRVRRGRSGGAGISPELAARPSGTGAHAPRDERWSRRIRAAAAYALANLDDQVIIEGLAEFLYDPSHGTALGGDGSAAVEH